MEGDAMIKRQVKYELATNRVLSVGYCDFKNDGSFDPTLHGIIENEMFKFIPGCRRDDEGNDIYWYYDEENDTFTNMIYGEITADGDLIEISFIKPEHRKPREGSIIVQLAIMPSPELIGKPLKYDRFKKIAYLKEDD
tara:strand:- start:59 stop:472 length:414 start_codon:yes stop_codon:yes gene_type:complete